MRTLDFDILERALSDEQRALLSANDRPCGFPVFLTVGDMQVEYSTRTMQILTLTFLNIVEGMLCGGVPIDNRREDANIPPGSTP